MSAATDRAARSLAFLAPLFLVLAGWQALVSLGLLDPSFTSSPLGIAGVFRDTDFTLSLLPRYLVASLFRLAAGFLSGCVLGVGLGLFMGCSRWAYRALHPLMTFLMAVPTICWVPVLLMTIGMGAATVIIAVFLDCLFPLAHATYNGVRSVSRETVWAARSLGASRVRIVLRVLLPGSAVSIVTGLRLAAGYAWRALVGAEMIGAASGVGFMVFAARAFYDVDVMFVGLVMISLGGLAMDRLLVGAIERSTLRRWGMVTATW